MNTTTLTKATQNGKDTLVIKLNVSDQYDMADKISELIRQTVNELKGKDITRFKNRGYIKQASMLMTLNRYELMNKVRDMISSDWRDKEVIIYPMFDDEDWWGYGIKLNEYCEKMLIKNIKDRDNFGLRERNIFTSKTVLLTDIEASLKEY